MTYLHSSVNTPMRDALKQMLRDFPAKYHLNLAFHQRINLEAVTRNMKMTQ